MPQQNHSMYARSASGRPEPAREKDSGAIEGNKPATQHSALAVIRRGVGCSTRIRPLGLVTIVVVIIVAAGLHAIGGAVLLNIGFDGFSPRHPLFYVVVGLLVVVAAVKLKHVLGFVHNRAKSRRGR